MMRRREFITLLGGAADGRQQACRPAADSREPLRVPPECSFATPSDQITLLIRKHVELLDRLLDCCLFVRLTIDNSDQLRRRAA